MRKALILCALLFSGLAHPCFGAVTVQSIGKNATAAGALTLVITTTADCPTGSTLFVATAENLTSVTISTATDSAGNTYTGGTAINGTGLKIRPFHALSAIHLPLGGTITITYSASTVAQAAVASCAATGITATDTQAAGASGNNTSPSITGSVLAQASEIVFGFVAVAVGGSDSFTEDATYSPVDAALQSGGLALHLAYRQTNATTAPTYAPTLGTTRQWVANLRTYKAISASCGSLALGGAGC